MNRENLRQLEENYQRFMQPLLSDDDVDDRRFADEFERLLDSKTLRVMKAEEIQSWRFQNPR